MELEACRSSRLSFRNMSVSQTHLLYLTSGVILARFYSDSLLIDRLCADNQVGLVDLLPAELERQRGTSAIDLQSQLRGREIVE